MFVLRKRKEQSVKKGIMGNGIWKRREHRAKVDGKWNKGNEICLIFCG